MDQLRITMLAWLASAKDALRPRGDAERGDVPGWVLITLMTAALVVLIWGVASQRLVEIFNHAMDSLSSI
ncbi:hypothetical protein HMPREF9004_1869 [Schaalia cardiffensis F0333]|uniref:Uncharacterized protein n=2 Tax=Schaalia TaxID=2529408 RepID=N6X1N2_9ACTO|nr:hypothetical protein HMPREF9004_1869 [Schaalia cardiffensis F0333]